MQSGNTLKCEFDTFYNLQDSQTPPVRHPLTFPFDTFYNLQDSQTSNYEIFTELNGRQPL